MTPKFLVWVSREMVVSSREDGKEKGELPCRGRCAQLSVRSLCDIQVEMRQLTMSV